MTDDIEKLREALPFPTKRPRRFPSGAVRAGKAR